MPVRNCRHAGAGSSKKAIVVCPTLKPPAFKNFFYPPFLQLAGGPLKSSCPMGWWCT
jgi:hypothetical protein